MCTVWNDSAASFPTGMREFFSFLGFFFSTVRILSEMLAGTFFLQARSSHLLSASAGPTALFLEPTAIQGMGGKIPPMPHWWVQQQRSSAFNTVLPRVANKQTTSGVSDHQGCARRVSFVLEICQLQIRKKLLLLGAARPCTPCDLLTCPVASRSMGKQPSPFVSLHEEDQSTYQTTVRLLYWIVAKKNGLKAFACVQCKPFLPVQGASKGCLTDVFF